MEHSAAGDDEPWVVVVDHEETRQVRVAHAVRCAGAQPVVVRTPLEAIALVQAAATDRRWLAAVAVAEHLTQTGGAELAEFLAEAHPELPLMVIGGRAPTEESIVLPADGSDATEPIRVLVDRGRASITP